MALTSSVTIVGNSTFDPELRQTREGKPVVNLTIAVNPRSFDRTKNEWVDGEPVFYKASAFGNLAEHIAGSVSRGTRVIAHGTMKANSWTDKDSGTKRTDNILQIEEIGLSLQFTHAQVAQSSPKSQPADNGGEAWGSYGDDTPF